MDGKTIDGEYEKCTQNKQTEHIKTPINSVAEELTLHKGAYTYIKHGGHQSEHLHAGNNLQEKTDTIRQSLLVWYYT